MENTIKFKVGDAVICNKIINGSRKVFGLTGRVNSISNNGDIYVYFINKNNKLLIWWVSPKALIKTSPILLKLLEITKN